MIEFTGGYQEHDELNPLLWDGLELKEPIRAALLEIAEEFVKFIDIDMPVQDLLITGGQASYHYTPHSDLDLHLVIDYSSISCDQEVAELLDTKRLLFKQQHSITLRGIPVEPGTEDAARPSVSAAYSLMTREWIRPPKNHSGTIDSEKVDQQVQQWARIIRAVLRQNSPELAEKVLKLLRKYRKTGLKLTGEYGPENLAYKALRNQNLVAQLADRVNQDIDRRLTRESPKAQ